jgi:hypothetical protein
MVRAIRAYALSYPFALVAAFFCTWSAARRALGHWPRPSLDDPGMISWWVDIPYFVTGAFLVVGLPTFVVAVGALIYLALRDVARRKHLLLSAAASALFMIAAVCLLRWDPLRIVGWFMD